MSGSASWSGKVCVRCGKARTANVSHGQPVCSPCLALQRAESARQGQPPRHCPVDSTAMTLVMADGVAIDRCGTCGGVFLDKGELEALREVARKRGEWKGGWEGFLQGALPSLF